MNDSKNAPTASVIIPAYNAAGYIGKTIESVLAQTYPDFECLVIDDGSTDNTLEIVSAYNDPRIRIIPQKNSGGPAKPRNVGISSARGKYIFMFDSDDIMLPKKLEHAIMAMEASPDVSLLFTNFQSIDEDGQIINPNYLEEYDTLWNLVGGRSIQSMVIASEKLFPALVKINFIGTSSVVIRRNALNVTDRFNEELRNSDDRLFWITYAKTHKFKFINDIYHQYRIQQQSISKQGFERRAPSKIKALTIVRDLCEEKALKKVVEQQINRDYIALSYSFRKKSDPKNALKYSLKSFQYGIYPQSFRAVFASLISFVKRK